MAQALHIDKYSLTMSQFYWSEGMDDRVSFELFVRSLPPNRGYLIVAGLGTALWHLRNWHFTQEEMDYLRADGEFEEGFLDYIRDLDFTCDVWAIPEGTPVGAQVPLLRITGPRIQATLVESLLLSIINHQTMIASKAARIVTAAGGRPVWDFSLRRLHGPEASLGVARAAYIAGCAGTATMEAGRILKIPTTGTMAHAQIMAFGEDHEQEVFERVMRMYPENHALLVDTYDTQRGIQRALAASVATGIPLKAIRIDSDLEEMALIADGLFDGVALTDDIDPLILASNDLDEYAITRLRDLPIDGYGVGTMLGTSADAPHLGGVYKLVEQHEREPQFVMKLTEGKQTDPGCHQVWRYYAGDAFFADVLYLDSERPSKPQGAATFVRPLIQQVMVEGRILRPQPSLYESRARCVGELSRIPKDLLDLDGPTDWPLQHSPGLWRLRAQLGDKEARKQYSRGSK